MKIIGAGLSGLLCGAMNPGSTIYEAQKSLPNNHGAILRFRDDKISRALNIPFKKVRVRKGIWIPRKGFVHPAINLSNMYSRKCTGEFGARSIDNLDTVTRYIAPDDFIQQLADRCEIRYGHYWGLAFANKAKPTISTIPLPVMLKAVLDFPELDVETAAFKRQPIWSRTFEFQNTNLYQTIYFPDPSQPLYRASFTGNKMICEYTSDDRECPLTAFGMGDALWVGSGVQVKRQEYGKIIEIPSEQRRAIIGHLSHKHNIYSLGRYATWRNILLDDVFDDIRVIQRLMRMDEYSHRIEAS